MPANDFLVDVPRFVQAGLPFDVTIYALDPYGNIDTNYTGTVPFTTTDMDSGVMLQANYTFTVGTDGDNGVPTFAAGATLYTVGDQTLTAADANDGTITSTARVKVGGG